MNNNHIQFLPQSNPMPPQAPRTAPGPTAAAAAPRASGSPPITIATGYMYKAIYTYDEYTSLTTESKMKMFGVNCPP